MLEEIVQAVAQFGVAGLMGTLWVWERSMTRKREAELSDAHAGLMAQRQQLRELMRVVHRNTRAIERFDQTQVQLKAAIERVQGVDTTPRAV